MLTMTSIQAWERRKRIERAVEQRMSLLQLHFHSVSRRWVVEIESSQWAATGKSYNVTLEEGEGGVVVGRCTCMDYQRRKMACKHVYTILGKDTTSFWEFCTIA